MIYKYNTGIFLLSNKRYCKKMENPVCLFELMEYKVQNMGSLNGVARRFELECCIFLRRQRKYSARI